MIKEIDGFKYIIEKKQKIVGIICDSPSKVSFIFKKNALSKIRGFSGFVFRKISEYTGASSLPQRIIKKQNDRTRNKTTITTISS